MVAQPTPASINTGYIMISGVLGVMKIPIVKAVARIKTPAKIVFLRPILEAIIPTGI